MKEIYNAMEQFIDLAGVRWKEWILELLVNEDAENNIEDLTERFEDLLEAIQECLLNDDIQGLQSIREKFGKEEALYNHLIKHAKRTMVSYNDSAILRSMQDEDKLWKKMVDDIFNNQILRYDPEFCKTFEEYDLDDEEELLEIARTLEVLARICISRKYTKKAIARSCWELFRLNEQNCMYIAEKIDSHWRELQMNRIIEFTSEE